MDLEKVRMEWDSKYLKEELTKRYLPHYGRKFYEELKDLKANILDIGCGDLGCWSEDVKNQINLVGLDISKIALQRAKAINRKFKLVFGVAQNLPFKENSFDNAICIETIMYVGPDYKQVLEELKRVSKKDIVLTFSHKDYTEKQGISVKDNIAEYRQLIGNKPIAVFNEDDVIKLMKELNLNINKMKVYTVEELGIKDFPQETKAVIYIECEKK